MTDRGVLSVQEMVAMVGSRPLPPLRPDPEPRPRSLTIISADDHLVEPPDTFAGRLPHRYSEVAPRIVEDDAGHQYWDFEGERVLVNGSDALMSWEREHLPYNGPVRFDQMRPGMWDVDARVHDMDLAGVAASLCFPSMIFGFAGQRFMRFADRELGHASMRAYNDWIAEGWVGPHPERLIGCQITWLLDSELAANEIRRNAARGFKAVAFSENPEKLGLPSIYSGYWDPLFAACEETETVVNLHIGSSSTTIQPSSDSPLEVIAKLFTLNAIMAALDWVYAMIPVKFPRLQIAMSEGGIAWVPWLIDRIDYQHGRVAGRDRDAWRDAGLTPSEALLRNFHFTSFYDPKGWQMWEMMDPSKLMVEVDYPHSDSNWPDSQQQTAAQLAGLPEHVVRMVTHENASRTYRHPVPAVTTP
ncbi:MAG: amidohydrolase [Acidimicrobiales bacterium]|nr:amidohydrolase [Acidimicrobiales bacterium]